MTDEFLRMPNWYLPLAPYTMPTVFVRLRPEAVAALAAGADGGEKVSLKSDVSRQVIRDLSEPMKHIPGSCFPVVDVCAPTDTERFEVKGGAVHSARSAWFYLTQSEKVAKAAAAGQVSYIGLRPFRKVNRTREFRLFIFKRQLVAMSQYHLTRHFRRLEGFRKKYWQAAQVFVSRLAWRLEVESLVMDIYITSKNEILIFDLNPWGEPTDPLLLKSWERDWSVVSGLELMAPPLAIKGDVKVSF